jgi:hypothetical protein
MIYFVKNYVLICNKGAFSNYPVTAYEINKDLVSEKIIEEIKFNESLPSNKISNYLHKKLPEKLGCTNFSDPLTQIFTESWIYELEQTANNCVYESNLTFIKAYFGMVSWFEKIGNKENLLENLEKMEDFDFNLKIWGTSTYLQYCKKSLRINPELLARIIEKARAKYSADLDQLEPYIKDWEAYSQPIIKQANDAKQRLLKAKS